MHGAQNKIVDSNPILTYAQCFKDIEHMFKNKHCSSTILFFISILILALVLSGCDSGDSRSGFNFPNFSNAIESCPNENTSISSDTLCLNGNASISNNMLRLTSGANQSGSVWFPIKQPISEWFTTKFQFMITDSDSDERSGEGFVFVIQNDRVNAISEGGGNLGYTGIRDGIAIEFDTFRNADIGDLNGNHISVHSLENSDASNNEENSLGSTDDSLPDMSDGNIHVVEINYDLGMMTIFLDQTLVLRVAVNISDIANLDNGRAWVGFTASTGENTSAATDIHDILSWSFTGKG